MTLDNRDDGKPVDGNGRPLKPSELYYGPRYRDINTLTEIVDRWVRSVPAFDKSTPLTNIKHIKQEVAELERIVNAIDVIGEVKQYYDDKLGKPEVQEEPTFLEEHLHMRLLEELADVFILLCDQAAKEGGMNWSDMIVYKMNRNLERKFDNPIVDSEGVIHHDQWTE